MENSKKIRKRPAIISTICALGFAGIVISFPSMFSPFTKKLGEWVPAIYGMIITFNFIAYVGIWNMKRWGVEMFLAVFFAKMVFFLLTDQFGGITFVGIFFTILYTIPLIVFYKRMSLNL